MRIQSTDKAVFGDIILFEPISSYSSLQVKIDCIGQVKQNIAHVALFYKNEEGIPLMIESQAKGGVKISVLKDWRNYIIIRHDKRHLRSLHDILNKVGETQYDFSMIWAIFKNRVFGIPMYPNDDRMVVCSELINWCFRYTLDNKGNCTPVTLTNKLLN